MMFTLLMLGCGANLPVAGEYSYVRDDVQVGCGSAETIADLYNAGLRISDVTSDGYVLTASALYSIGYLELSVQCLLDDANYSCAYHDDMGDSTVDVDASGVWSTDVSATMTWASAYTCVVSSEDCPDTLPCTNTIAGTLSLEGG